MTFYTEPIKNFIISFYSDANLENLSNDDWNRWFIILELKYSSVYMCSMYTLLHEWCIYCSDYRHEFRYDNYPIR